MQNENDNSPKFTKRKKDAICIFTKILIKNEKEKRNHQIKWLYLPFGPAAEPGGGDKGAGGGALAGSISQ